MATTVVGIIPARYGSSRLPGKPLLDLYGKPIVQHVYERARRAKLLNAVIVATDDARIAEAVHRFGGTSVMTPPDLRSGSDRVAYVAKDLQAEIVANIQGDEPLIEPEMIDETIQTLLRDDRVEVSTPVKKITSIRELKDPSVVKVALDKEGFALYFSRVAIPYFRHVEQESMDLTRVNNHDYYKHIGLYVYRKDFLLAFTRWGDSPLEQAEQLEQLRILEHGHRIKCVVTEFDSLSVDTPEDLERIREFMKP